MPYTKTRKITERSTLPAWYESHTASSPGAHQRALSARRDAVRSPPPLPHNAVYDPCLTLKVACTCDSRQHGKLGGLTVLGTVGISVGGLVSFYGTKLLPKSLWGSLETIKSLHRNGGEWVWFMAMMCIYLGIQPHNLERPVSKLRRPPSCSVFLPLSVCLRSLSVCVCLCVCSCVLGGPPMRARRAQLRGRWRHLRSTGSDGSRSHLHLCAHACACVLSLFHSLLPPLPHLRLSWMTRPLFNPLPPPRA